MPSESRKHVMSVTFGDAEEWVRATDYDRLGADRGRLFAAIQKETADHQPSVATGRPCKCFLCAAKRKSMEEFP